MSSALLTLYLLRLVSSAAVNASSVPLQQVHVLGTDVLLYVKICI